MFVNAFKLRFSENDLTLTLGIHEGGDPKDMLQEVAVVMTPRTLKIMIGNTQNVLDQFEAEVGEIQVAPGKIASSLDEMVKAGSAVIEKSDK